MMSIETQETLSTEQVEKMAARNRVFEQDGWADELETELVAELLGDCDALIRSLRAAREEINSALPPLRFALPNNSLTPLPELSTKLLMEVDRLRQQEARLQDAERQLSDSQAEIERLSRWEGRAKQMGRDLQDTLGRVSRLEAACQSALDAIKRRDAVSLGDEVAKQLREALNG